jgi:hypothetical protein
MGAQRTSFSGYMFYILDFPAALGALIMAPLAWFIARGGGRLSWSQAVLQRAGLGIVRHHYYEPLLFESDLRFSLREKREIVGFDLNENAQVDLIKKFHFREELLSLPLANAERGKFCYHNGYFESGDAEFLYDTMRFFKPRRMVEIGSGNSTLLARRAIERNLAEDADYVCDHVCIEPYEAPWLEATGAKIMRSRVELCPMQIFEDLKSNDILFIDSSHVIRPQGDVLHEYLHILGRLAPGVLIHVHDIFTPYDYIPEMIIADRRMWDEQYLLEAFLCFNRSFEVIGALNWLNREHRDLLTEACPVLIQEQGREPCSFWLRRLDSRVQRDSTFNAGK